MLKNEYFSHTSPEGKTLKDRFQEEKPASIRNISRIGENIYQGAKLDYSTDIKTQARLIVDGWMTSPGTAGIFSTPAIPTWAWVWRPRAKCATPPRFLRG